MVLYWPSARLMTCARMSALCASTVSRTPATTSSLHVNPRHGQLATRAYASLWTRALPAMSKLAVLERTATGRVEQSAERRLAQFVASIHLALLGLRLSCTGDCILRLYTDAGLSIWLDWAGRLMLLHGWWWSSSAITKVERSTFSCGSPDESLVANQMVTWNMCIYHTGCLWLHLSIYGISRYGATSR